MAIQLPPLDARILKWDPNDMHERVCPVCKKDAAAPGVEFIRPDSLHVKLCTNCDTYYISPAPSDDQLNAFYASYDETHRRTPEMDIKDAIRNYNAITPNSVTSIKVIGSLMDLKNARVLDVGFGRALYLYQLKKLGAIPYGVELDHTSIQFAKTLGITDVIFGTINDLPSEKKFDLIILNDLIEHLLEPMEFLRKASSMLSEDGMILISTPNGSAVRREAEPVTFRVDLEHMQYFTPYTCQFVANELSMQIAHLEVHDFPFLTGIDKPVAHAKESASKKIRKMIRSLPGVKSVQQLIHKITSPEPRDEREGIYRLLCVLQKRS